MSGPAALCARCHRRDHSGRGSSSAAHQLRSRNFSCRRCPFCGGRGGRWGVASRTVHDLGDSLSGRPGRGASIFATPHIAVWPVVAPSLPISPTSPRSKSQYTHRVQQTAVRLVIEDDMPYRIASWHLRRQPPRFLFLGPPSRIGSRPRGKKAGPPLIPSTSRRLTRFSGYIAIDELYDGPFCVLSLVDNRAFIRLSFRVLEHDPTQNDIRRFLADFKARLDVRGLAVRGRHDRRLGAVSRAAERVVARCAPSSL